MRGAELSTAGALIALCAVLFWQTLDFPHEEVMGALGPAFVPRLWMGVLVLLALGLIVRALRRPAAALAFERGRLVLVAVIGCLLYAVAIPCLGYHAATVLFLLGLLLALRVGWRLAAGASLGFVITADLVFFRILGVAFPPAGWFGW